MKVSFVNKVKFHIKNFIERPNSQAMIVLKRCPHAPA